LDKAQIFIVTSTAGMISLAFITLNNSFLIASITLVFVALSVILLMHMELLAKYGHHLNASFFRKSWITRILDGFSLLRPRQLYITLFCTIAFHCVLVLQMFFLINAFSEITLFHAFIGTSAMMFVKSLLPISLGDLGIREAGSIFFFSTFGISHVAALNASLLLFVINVFLPSVVGTFFLRHQHVSPVKIFQFLKKTNNTTAQ
jgi:uncharacterized membrane protein YbhN (UPF0104 family)